MAAATAAARLAAWRWSGWRLLRRHRFRLGVIVVEAAGNGNQDLDGTEYGDGNRNAFPTAVPIRGAIIVGAGSAPGCSSPARGRLSFSNYGSRVNVQGWGQCVVTSGYGVGLQGVNMGNDAYHQQLRGDVEREPDRLGRCRASLEHRAATGRPDDPGRCETVATGTAQTGSDHIGPLPNLRTALGLFVRLMPEGHIPLPKEPIKRFRPRALRTRRARRSPTRGS